MRWLQHRKYRSGTSWGLWLWTDVDSEFIARLHIIKTPWFAVCLHWLNMPDPEPHEHDHPVSFLSIILSGKYGEKRGGKLYWRRWFNFIRASSADTHRIVAVFNSTVTICFMGPKTREWGYHTPEGWVYWKDYQAKRRATASEKAGESPQ